MWSSVLLLPLTQEAKLAQIFGVCHNLFSIESSFLFSFFLQASSSSTLRFYATYRENTDLVHILWDLRIILLHMRNSEYSSHHLQSFSSGESDRSAREGSAWLHVCNWHQKSRASVSTYLFTRGERRKRLLVPMGEPLRRLCVRSDRTTLKCNTQRAGFLVTSVPWDGYNSIPITLLRTTLHPNFILCKFVPSAQQQRKGYC